MQEYLDVCGQNGFTRYENKLQLSEYLHDLGVCLHFQEEEDSLLYRTVILKTTWGTDAVYKVLDNDQVVNNQGHFTRKDLKSIWHEEKYAAKRGELLELMKKFQLCYQIPGKKNAFIAPQLLSDNQPEYDWDESSNLILRYTYPDFMPKGIMTRFIVAMHQHIEKQKFVWKSGVILMKESARAEVIEYYGKREIIIRVVGNNKRNFLTILSNELDKTNTSYKRLKYQKLIPCNCEVCNKNSQLTHSYSYETLRKFIDKGQRYIQCQESFQMINILGLIDDIFINKVPKSIDGDFRQDSNTKTTTEAPNIKINIPINVEPIAKAGDNIKQIDSKIGVGISNGEINANTITGNNNQASLQDSNYSQDKTTHNETEKTVTNSWSLGNIIALITLLATIFLGLYSGIFTEEGRKFLNLEKQEQPEKINDSKE